MSLYVFSMVVLSVVYMLVFGTWWDGSAPFKIHVAALSSSMVLIASIILLVAIFPVFARRPAASRKKKSLDDISWGSDISASLSSPAAVLDGYQLAFANKAFLSELGMSTLRDQVVGMPLTNLVHPGDHLALAKFMASSVQGQHSSDMTKVRMLCWDGTTLPAWVALSPLRDDGSSNLNLLQFSPASAPRPDIPHPGAQSDYHLIIDRIEQIVFQVNANSELIFLNPSWERLLDHLVPDSLGKSLLSFVHPEDRPMVESRISSLTQGKRASCHLQARLIARNGNSFWVELRAKATSSYKGERTSVIGTLTDINRMKTTEVSLRANRRSLSMLLSNIPGMVYRCKNDRNWSFEFASDGSVEVTGYEPYEMVNTPNFSYIQIIHPDDRQWAWECVQQAVSRQHKFQLVYRIITRSGSVKWVWEQGKGVYSSAGDLLALEGFITDIANEGDETAMRSFQHLFSEESTS